MSQGLNLKRCRCSRIKPRRRIRILQGSCGVFRSRLLAEEVPRTRGLSQEVPLWPYKTQEAH